jgi:GAF domain-containing protein
MEPKPMVLADATWASDSILLVGFAVSAIASTVYGLLERRRIRALKARMESLVAEEHDTSGDHHNHLQAFLKVSRTISSETNLQKVLDCITQACLENFNCQQASLMMLSQATGELEVRSAAGHTNLDQIIGARMKRGYGIAGWVAEKNTPMIIDKHTDMSAYAGIRLAQPQLASAMVVPVRVKDRVVGVLNVASRDPEVHYEDRDLQVLQVFAENAGMCIRHVEQVEWMRYRLSRFVAPESEVTSPP